MNGQPILDVDAGRARKWLEDLIFEDEAARRFTQDSPVLPDVWIRYGLRAFGIESKSPLVDLLATPHRDVSAAEFARAMETALKGYDRKSEVAPGAEPNYEVAYSQSSVAVRVDFTRLCSVLLPMSDWWGRVGFTGKKDARVNLVGAIHSEAHRRSALIGRMKQLLARSYPDVEPSTTSEDTAPLAVSSSFVWLVRVIGTLGLALKLTGSVKQFLEARLDAADIVQEFLEIMRRSPDEPPNKPLLWTVSLNRPAKTSVCFSALAVKADAARGLFNLRCDKLAWAVIDTGIDVRHPAFRIRDPDGRPLPGDFSSRVQETYDFTRIRQILAGSGVQRGPVVAERAMRDMRRSLHSGRSIDWSLLQPLIGVPHRNADYRPPGHDHGTHVAGILAGDFRRKDDDAQDLELEGDLVGVCPDLVLYDLRVLDDKGQGDEFGILAALQFVRWFNALHDQPKIHGVNLSLSLKHDVANYACGQTPICDECERTVASGVVVVAAAGNDGYTKFSTPMGDSEGYRSMSISDPGNADGVITVGATHRNKPHTYGVSYFSSRGPTGDGRIKPDIVAPGEKITAPVLGRGVGTKDGTSMAAPHVSGAAALLLARHRELLGHPQRVKEILCATATDLRRERYFQGAGMVDILRALQSV